MLFSNLWIYKMTLFTVLASVVFFGNALVQRQWLGATLVFIGVWRNDFTESDNHNISYVFPFVLGLFLDGLYGKETKKKTTRDWQRTHKAVEHEDIGALIPVMNAAAPLTNEVEKVHVVWIIMNFIGVCDNQEATMHFCTNIFSFRSSTLFESELR